MSRIRCTLLVTLKSDLCPGTGDGFSSSIDLDVCYDAQGLPVLPGRRIKGCLREAAQLVGYERLDEVFGVSGESAPGSIWVSAGEVREDLKVVVLDDVQQTLGRYTSLRAMTKIDDTTGGAEENTLRYVRVVRHYVLGGEGLEELVFVVPIDVDEEYVDGLRDLVVPALRNIGLGRNRGLGAVRCELRSPDVATTNDGVYRFGGDFEVSHGEGEMCRVSYVVTLGSPVMLPRDNGNRSGDFIPGTSVLGAFASRLRDSADFDELFLRGRTRFSPLYPIDADGMRCIPSPSFVVKVKGGDEDGLHRNGLTFTCGEGQAAKPLRGGFVGSDWLPVPVVTETVYHHSRQGEGTLYTQRCLGIGQRLCGFVECPSDFISEIKNVLASGELSFGRSKTAQYALCVVEPAGRDFSREDERVFIEAGENYALVLESDLLLRDATGRYTTDTATLCEALSHAFGGWVGTPDAFAAPGLDAGASQLGTSVRSLTVSGYNAKWNQKKPHVPAFAAGSTIVFTVPDGTPREEVPAIWHLGDRQHEGFGRLLLVRVSEVRIEEERKEVAESERRASADERVRLHVVERAKAVDANSKILTPSFIGRLALMVRESTDWEDLRRHIATVKSNDKRKAVLDDSGTEGVVGIVRAAVPLDRGWQLLQECLSLYLDILKYRGKREGAKRGEQ